ncbi:hypothetical protein AM593_03109, partial [Mytilus galloprovincialis]
MNLQIFWKRNRAFCNSSIWHPNQKVEKIYYCSLVGLQSEYRTFNRTIKTTNIYIINSSTMLLRSLLSLCLVLPVIEAYLSSAGAFIQTSTGLHHVEAEIRFLNRNKRTLKTNFGPHSTYRAINGLTCLVCPPGFYRKSDCTTNGTIAACEPCAYGHYNNRYNIAISCARCIAYCIDKNAVPETTCNTTADMTCRCKDGYFNHSKGSGEWICLQHSPCQPGTELRNTGTPEHNTVCTMCENGTFSPNVSLTAKCLPCSTCDGERKVHKACNGNTDVICTSHGEW